MKKKYAVCAVRLSRYLLNSGTFKKEIQQNTEEMDRVLFLSMANDMVSSIKGRYKSKRWRPF